MSISSKTLLMYGAEIQYAHYKMLVGDDDVKYDKLDIFYDETPGKVGILSDGMNGEYAAVGTILSRFNVPDGITPVEQLLSVELTPERKKEIHEKLHEILGFIPKCQLLIVKHWY